MQAGSHGIRRLSILGAVALLLALPAVASAQRGGGHGGHRGGGHHGGGHHGGGHHGGGHHGGGHHGGGHHGGGHHGSHHGGHHGGGHYGHYKGGHHHGHYGGYRHYGHHHGHYHGGYYRYGLYHYGYPYYPYYSSYYPYSYSYSYGAPYYRGYVGSYDAVAIETLDRDAPPEQRRELTTDLRQEPGRLSLDIGPADATVYLDDRFVGTGEDLARGLLIEPGAHVLEVMRPGRQGVVWRFEVAPGAEVAQRIELPRP